MYKKMVSEERIVKLTVYFGLCVYSFVQVQIMWYRDIVWSGDQSERPGLEGKKGLNAASSQP